MRGYGGGVKSRLAIVALAVAAMMLSGCSGQPATEATTPAFTSDAQAFAAAEQTYRNYVDALNHVDLSDPKTFEAVYAWTTGDANAADRKSFSEMHARTLVVSGTTRAPTIEPASVRLEPLAVELSVCLDVSEVKLVAPDGTSAVPPGRADLQSRKIVLVGTQASPTGLLISSFEPRQGAPACAR